MSSEVDVFGVLAPFASQFEYQDEVVQVIAYMVENHMNQNADAIIALGFETLLKMRYRKFNYEKLCGLRRRHSTNMATQSQSSQAVHHKFKSPATPRNPNCQYDFYVISAATSENWVIYSLLPALGCDYFALRGYFKSEDTPLGVPSLSSQETPILRSAYILVILTGEFLRSSECGHLYEIASSVKEPTQMALLVRDDVQIPVTMGALKRFYFHSLGNEYQWIELAKFLLRNVQ